MASADDGWRVASGDLEGTRGERGGGGVEVT